MLNDQQFYLYDQIHTSQTVGQLYSDTSSYGECSLLERSCLRDILAAFMKQQSGLSAVVVVQWSSWWAAALIIL